MTIGLVCITFLVIRFAEELVRRLVNWVTKKETVKKQYLYKRIVAIVSPELHAQIKAHVFLLNMSITEYILTAVTEKLKREQHG